MTPWTVARQAPLSVGFSRQEYWSEQPCPSSGVFLMQGSNPGLLNCKRILYHLSHAPGTTCCKITDIVEASSDQSLCHLSAPFSVFIECCLWVDLNEISISSHLHSWKPRPNSLDRGGKSYRCRRLATQLQPHWVQIYIPAISAVLPGTPPSCTGLLVIWKAFCKPCSFPLLEIPCPLSSLSQGMMVRAIY